MTFSAEQIIDRRRLRRKLGFWRIISLLMLVVLVIALISVFGGFSNSEKNTHHIARVKISGVIMRDEKMTKLLDELAENPKVDAVILEISSPGGATSGGEELYLAVRNLAEKKPVVTTVGSLAASAGYMIAIASDHIVARQTSIVGSIGVLFQYVDASQLLDNIGVKVGTIKSAPLKAEPSPFNEASPEAKAMIDRVVKDTSNWFKELVVERRSLPVAKVDSLADGSIFTGRQALENGLIDAIGGSQEAVNWLETEKNVKAKLKVVDWSPKQPGFSNWSNSAILLWKLKQLGLFFDTDTVNLVKNLLPEEKMIVGMVSRMTIFDK